LRAIGGSTIVMAGGCPAPGPAERRVVVGTGDGVLSLEEVEWKGKVARGGEIASLLKDELNGRFE
jgi:hypothetical protein